MIGLQPRRQMTGSSFAFRGRTSSATKYALALAPIGVFQQRSAALWTGGFAESARSCATLWRQTLLPPPPQLLPQPPLQPLLLQRPLQLQPHKGSHSTDLSL